MNTHGTVRPLTSGEMLELGVSMLQQLPRTPNPNVVRWYMRHKGNLGHDVRKLFAVPLATDIVIRVDRTLPVEYPKSAYGFLASELQCTGPAEYTIAQLNPWLHAEQKKGGICGIALYRHLETKGMLQRCLGYSDLLAIRELEPKIYYGHFGDKKLYGWKSVVRGSTGSCEVPFIMENAGHLIVTWKIIEDNLGPDHFALRFVG